MKKNINVAKTKTQEAIEQFNKLGIKPVLVEWEDSRLSIKKDRKANTLLQLIEPGLLLDENKEAIVLIEHCFMYKYKEHEYRYSQVIPKNRINKMTFLKLSESPYIFKKCDEANYEQSIWENLVLIKWNDANSATNMGSKTKKDILDNSHVDEVFSIHSVLEVDGDIVKATGGYIYLEKPESKNIQIFSKKFIDAIIPLKNNIKKN